ncbi:Type IV fimbrial biogenesis protein PilV [Photobacterium marinum]|uniref:Type IV fimbrial biogenesis protein PilV n=1 Tax=Photobacterium marinum TaxID=1056511 RepID=L8JBB1_9GAMM|nr:prepilin-type N-terminal cleavage/methylation domain-containing protein [Photobacterium marinum]ELR66101.1 Type IV fimbrial biogenesis protein PilV [Photobacterium marinum]
MISNNNGFSLLEVVISLFMMAAGVMGLIKMQSYMEVKSYNALKSIDALYLAEQQLEYFRTRAEVSSGVNLISYDDINSSQCPSIDTTVPPEYSLSCKVATIEALSGSAKKITVAAKWSDRWQNQQKVELTTIISRYSEFD